MPDELAAAGGALSVDNPMVGVDDEEEEGGRGPAAVSQADMNAALEEFAAADNMTTDAKLALANLLGVLMAVSAAAAVPAEDLGTTITQAATAVFAHFSESPTNWCELPLLHGSWLDGSTRPRDVQHPQLTHPFAPAGTRPPPTTPGRRIRATGRSGGRWRSAASRWCCCSARPAWRCSGA